LKDSPIQPLYIESVLNKYNSESSYNTYRLRLCSLINEAIKIGMTSNPMKGIKSKRTNARMHKCCNELQPILNEIKAYKFNVCRYCLMTCGCLSIPHREIRKLTWSDFYDDLTYIHLSGNRNKSGRNRIVPVPTYVRVLLLKGEPYHNIFSGTPQPLNQDYFKTLWSRFKRQSNTLEQGQT